MTAIFHSGSWRIEVLGDPVPQGSTRAFGRKGKVFTTNDPTGKIEKWRADVRADATRLVQSGNARSLTGPIAVRMTFRFRRPASHFLPANSKRPAAILRPDAPTWVAQDPDVDKLARAVLDALTTVCYGDDHQVAMLHAEQRWTDQAPGVAIEVAPL